MMTKRKGNATGATNQTASAMSRTKRGMSMCRRFNGKPVTRLIVTMPVDLVAAIDQLLAARPTHPARGCRSEFLRLAVAEKIGCELLLSNEHGAVQSRCPT